VENGPCQYNGPMEIEGRVAVVSGAAVGSGRAIAEALAAAGAEVVAADIDEAGGRCVRADMTDPASVRELIEGARPSILVNNAGGGGHLPPHFPEATFEQWGALLDLNLRAAMLATQVMLERIEGDGAVVNVSSSAGFRHDPYQSPEYGAAKAGLIRFTTALAQVGRVRINCLVPDWIATERLTQEDLASEPPPIPLAVVAESTLRLIRDDSLAGRVLVIDRGDEPRLV
jgi:NAD(P)-dependent dehydrogenase (short-subunit alcohol dehydrogenase family)